MLRKRSRYARTLPGDTYLRLMRPPAPASAGKDDPLGRTATAIASTDPGGANPARRRAAGPGRRPNRRERRRSGSIACCRSRSASLPPAVPRAIWTTSISTLSRLRTAKKGSAPRGHHTARCPVPSSIVARLPSAVPTRPAIVPAIVADADDDARNSGRAVRPRGTAAWTSMPQARCQAPGQGQRALEVDFRDPGIEHPVGDGLLVADLDTSSQASSWSTSRYRCSSRHSKMPWWSASAAVSNATANVRKRSVAGSASSAHRQITLSWESHQPRGQEAVRLIRDRKAGTDSGFSRVLLPDVQRVTGGEPRGIGIAGGAWKRAHIATTSSPSPRGAIAARMASKSPGSPGPPGHRCAGPPGRHRRSDRWRRRSSNDPRRMTSASSYVSQH